MVCIHCTRYVSLQSPLLTESHLEMVENLIKDLDFSLKQLMDIHKEVAIYQLYMIHVGLNFLLNAEPR